MFNRFDVVEAAYVFHHDFSVSGVTPNRRRDMGAQLRRLEFSQRYSLERYNDLTEEGKAVYDRFVVKYAPECVF